MTRFKTKKEFQKFLDEEHTCICGRLLTGLHEMNCSQIRKEWTMVSARETKRSTA